MCLTNVARRDKAEKYPFWRVITKGKGEASSSVSLPLDNSYLALLQGNSNSLGFIISFVYISERAKRLLKGIYKVQVI